MIITAVPSNSVVDWNEWFAPLFQFVNDNQDVVRAVTYIDSNSQLNNEILKRWKDETKASFWLRVNPDLFGDLGFVK